MTITIEKKHIFTFLGILAFIFLVFFGIKACGKPDYETTAKQMKLNTMATCYLAADVLSDYQQSWSSAISDKQVQNAEGEWERAYDFNEALKWRYQFYQNNGRMAVLDSMSGVVKNLMQDMDNPPSKYDKTQETFVGMYNDMNNLISLVKEPKGNIMTFSAKVNELMMAVDTKFKETDLKISVPEDSVKSKIMQIQLAQMSVLLAQKAKELKEKEEETKNFYAKSKANSDSLKKEGFQEIPSGNGVLYKVIKSSNGKMPQDTSLVKVHYSGKLLNGTVFDSSIKRGEPAVFRANQVIKGWTTALINMHEGEKCEVYIPFEQAYNERTQGDIPPYSDLLFEIELLKVNPK